MSLVLDNRFGGTDKMADPILEEIWRVRQELIKQHGGIDGLWKYFQKLDRAHRQRRRRRKGAKPIGAKPRRQPVRDYSR